MYKCLICFGGCSNFILLEHLQASVAKHRITVLVIMKERPLHIKNAGMITGLCSFLPMTASGSGTLLPVGEECLERPPVLQN